MEKQVKCYLCGRKLKYPETMRVIESPKDTYGVKVPVGKICHAKAVEWNERKGGG